MNRVGRSFPPTSTLRLLKLIGDFSTTHRCVSRCRRVRLQRPGQPVHSFATLLGDLATVVSNTVAPRLPGAEPFEVLTGPTSLQREAFQLLGVRLKRSQ